MDVFCVVRGSDFNPFFDKDNKNSTVKVLFFDMCKFFTKKLIENSTDAIQRKVMKTASAGQMLRA